MRAGYRHWLRQLAVLVALLPAGIAGSEASLVPVEEAVEAVAANLWLPSHRQGRLTVQQCDNCAPQAFRLDDGTRYWLGRERVDFDTFRAQLRNARHRDAVVAVYYATGSDRVTRVRLDLPADRGSYP